MDATKAIQILKDGQVYGKPLSEKQREFFANLAGTDSEGNSLDEDIEENEELKYGGTMKRIEIPEGPLYYMFALGGENNGIFKQDISFDNTKLGKDLHKFIKQVNIVKYGGDDIPPTADTNNIVEHKQQVFQNFLQKNTMNALAETEATNLMMAHDLMKQFGGVPKFALGGEDYDQPIGPETPLEHALRLQKEKEKMLFPQPTQMNNVVGTSNTEGKDTYQWSSNPFDQKTPSNPYQVSNTTMNGTPAPMVTPSTTSVMDKLTPDATRMDANPNTQASQRNSGVNYTQSTTSNVPYGQLAAQGIMTGMEGITHMLNMGEYKKQEEEYRKRLNADAVFTPVTGSNNRGTYDVNSGAFRPDQMVPQQFKGNSYGARGSNWQYKEGGEYEMPDDEIQDLIKQGYKIDFLD